MSSETLTAVDDTAIQTYGPKTINLDFGLARNFVWTFEMADVPRPIIGADFFGITVYYLMFYVVDTLIQLLRLQSKQ